MSIVIGCDSFLALRNLRTGLLDRWLNGEEIHVWVDPRQLAGSQRVKPEGVELACLEEFDVRKDSRLMKQVLAAYHARKCYYDPATIWADFLLSSHRHNQRKPLRRAASVSRAAGRLGLYWLAGSLGMARHWRSAFAQALRRHPVVDVYRERLQKVDATVVVGLSPEGLREMALMEAANSLGLSTMVVIRSRDNLAAKILHLPHADAYAVWSENTRQCLLSMYPETPPERVH
ncbi:MAG: hypothetical protein HZB35_10500, partial [Nitrospirae bacterium]|nr:hypothetical protein [Nitrospirota bacterium]